MAGKSLGPGKDLWSLFGYTDMASKWLLSAPITEDSFHSGWQLLWRQLTKVHDGVFTSKWGSHIKPLLKRLRELLERVEGKIVRA